MATPKHSPTPATGAKKGSDAHGAHAEPEAPKPAIISHDERLALSAEPRYPRLEGSVGKSVRQQFWLIGLNSALILIGLLLKLWEGEWTWLSLLYMGMIAKGVIRLVKFSWGFTPVGTDEAVFVRRNKEVLPKYWTKGWIEAKLFVDTTEAVSTKERPNTVVVSGFTKNPVRVAMVLLCPVKPDFSIVEEDGVPRYVHLMHKGDGVVAAIQARVNASIRSWGGKLFSAFMKAELDEDPTLWVKLCEAYGRLSIEMCRDMGLDLNADAETIVQWGRDNREKLILSLASKKAAVEPSELEFLTAQVFQPGWSAPEPEFTEDVMKGDEEITVARAHATAYAVSTEAVGKTLDAAKAKAEELNIPEKDRPAFIRDFLAANTILSGDAEGTAVLGSGGDPLDTKWKVEGAREGGDTARRPRRSRRK